MKNTMMVCLVLLLASCRSQQASVDHVVFCWLKSPGDDVARQRLIDESETLRKIPGVLSVVAGKAISSTRPVVDSSYDVGLIITFKDEQSMRAYDSHPIHKKLMKEVILPLTDRRLVYDIRNCPSQVSR